MSNYGLSIGDTTRAFAKVYDQYFREMPGQPIVWDNETPGRVSMASSDCGQASCVLLTALLPGNAKIRASAGKVTFELNYFVSSGIDRVLQGAVNKSTKYTINWWPGCSWNVWIENTQMSFDWRNANNGFGSITARARLESSPACNTAPWSQPVDNGIRAATDGSGFSVTGGYYFLTTTFDLTSFTKKGMSGILTYHFVKFGGDNGRTFDITEKIDLK
jgi:hypothetical protein